MDLEFPWARGVGVGHSQVPVGPWTLGEGREWWDGVTSRFVGRYQDCRRFGEISSRLVRGGVRWTRLGLGGMVVGVSVFGRWGMSRFWGGLGWKGLFEA